MSERPTQDDEVLKLAKECGIDATQDTLCRYEGWEEPILSFATKIREKDATIAERTKLANDRQEHIWELEATIAQQKEEISVLDSENKILRGTIQRKGKSVLPEVVQLQSELSATQAREAMLVEAIKQFAVHAPVDTPCWVCDALSNSTEHTEKFLAEVRAKALEGVADVAYDGAAHGVADELRAMANELREK